nr:calcium-binding protein [Kineosporia babensis]
MRRTRVSLFAATAFAVGVAPLLFALPAQAADTYTYVNVGSSEGRTRLFYDGNIGISSRLDVILDETDDKFVFTLKDNIEIRPYDGCAYPDAADNTKVVCEIPKSAEAPALAEFYLGNATDRVLYTNNTSGENFTTFNLGVGNDYYETQRPEAPDAIIEGGEANDTILAGTGAVVYGGHGEDNITLVGGAGTVYGGDHNDTINGGAGDDTLHGEAGDDIIYGNDGDDYIVGGTGNDQLYGGRHDDTIYGNSGDDTIFGNSGDDYISGGAGVDTISGGAGNNTIVDV